MLEEADMLEAGQGVGCVRPQMQRAVAAAGSRWDGGGVGYPGGLSSSAQGEVPIVPIFPIVPIIPIILTSLSIPGIPKRPYNYNAYNLCSPYNYNDL